MKRLSPKGTLAPCHNGPSCVYLAKKQCRYFHPPFDQLHAGKTRRLRHQSNNLEDLVSTLALKCASYERILNALLQIIP